MGTAATDLGNQHAIGVIRSLSGQGKWWHSIGQGEVCVVTIMEIGVKAAMRRVSLTETYGVAEHGIPGS